MAEAGGDCGVEPHIGHYENCLALLPTATITNVQDQAPRVAVLPVGSFEQQDAYLPLITDTAIAAIITREVDARYPVLVLPPITVSCSHEHGTWPGSVSISVRTLNAVVDDIRL
ncbi:creatininase family protein [Streptomyces roseoverticillatus]|uniref:creatininase family protein n=1 Tax=Streptomyces roseoverticillatus TaxID=66429 RepID=UPI00340A1CB8